MARFRGESRSEEAYRVVRDRIVQGLLRPGKPLSRRALARELGIGFLPVTDAVKRLEYDGLLESKPRSGTRVKIPTFQEVRDLVVIREAIEVESARLFAVTADENQRGRVQETAAHLDRLITNRSAPATEFLATHVLFHRTVAEYSGCSLLQSTVEKAVILQQTWLNAMGRDLRFVMDADHLELSRILSAGDSERAGRAMRGHVGSKSGVLLEEFEKTLQSKTVSSSPMRRSKSAGG